MTPCVCGCPMHGGSCHRCGCSYYEADDGSEVGTLTVDRLADPYTGIYGIDRKWDL